MLRQLTIALSFPPVIWRRLLSHFGLALAVWSGMALAAGMVVSIPVYAEASGYRILLAALTERAVADPLPPFAMVYRYGGASDPSISWQQYLLTDQLAGNLPAAGIDLPAPPGVRFAATEKLRVGFPDGAGREVLFARIGFLSGIERMLRYFPTLYDQGPPFVIGNLDYSFDSQGGLYPYEVWLSLAPDAGLQTVAAAGIGYGLRMIRSTPQTLLDLDLRRPERQGLFGLLSVGFLATTMVTVIGFVAYTLLSFQRRLVELGVLRAIGLSTRQLSMLLVLCQA